MKAYLIQFTYNSYYRDMLRNITTITLLVYAESYDEAVKKLTDKYKQAEKFINLTIE
jgi:hypothetical protein